MERHESSEISINESNDSKTAVNGKKSLLETVYIAAGELKYPIIITIPVMLILIFTIYGFKQLPGPLYGGDIYWHYGETLDIYNGASPMANHQVSGEYAYYGWLTQFLIAWTAKLTFLNLETVYLFFPAFLLFFVGIASYFLGMEVFKNRDSAMMLTLILVSYGYTATNIWRILGDLILMMTFLLFLMRAVKTEKIIYSLLAGLSMGLAGLTHVIAFPAMAVFLTLFFIYRIFLSHIHASFKIKEMKISITEDGNRLSIFKNIMIFAPIMTLGLLISLLFFGPILFIYHGVAKNPLQDYTEPDMSKYGMDSMFKSLGETFFNLSSPISIIISLMTLLGAYVVIKNRRDFYARIVLLLVASSFIAGFHYFITIPIFGKALIPMYFFSFLMKVTSALLIVYAANEILKMAKGFNQLVKYSIFLFLAANIISVAFATYNDQWTSNGRNDRYPVFDEISSWVAENTDDSDVFLSPEELSFSINGLTGRKIMISRRTHFSPYLDIDERIADANVILYGNNTVNTIELLKKYNVTYLYWDANWAYFAQNEPSLTALKYENYLKDNGVSYQKVHTYLDPAWEKNQPQYDLLAILPETSNQSAPWNTVLGSHLKLEKTFYIQGQEYAKIYSIAK